MDELLANLDPDPPMFDAPSVLGSAFDMESGFITDAQDVSLYSDMSSLRPATSAQNTVPTPLPLASNEIDYLADDADQPSSAKVKKEIYPDLPTLSPPPLASTPKDRQPTVPIDTLVPETPDTPLEAERKRQRPLAEGVVTESWQSNRNPADFVSAVRLRLPVRGQRNPSSIVEESSTPAAKVEPKDTLDSVQWRLPEASEGALLDALFLKLVKANATSSRLMNYLSYALVTGIVSQRAMVSTCLKWVSGTPRISERVLISFAKLLVQIIPHYCFSFEENAKDLGAEVKEFLGVFTMIIKCTATSPSLAPELVSVLSHDRVVALVRACARREPCIWQQIDAAIAGLDLPAVKNEEPYQHTFSPRSAYTVAPELRQLVARLKKGLAVGITSLETIVHSVGNVIFPKENCTLPMALQTAFGVTLAVFGTDIAKSLRHLWSQGEGKGGDYTLLVALEKEAAKGSASQQSSQKYGFRNKVIACEAIVRFLGERACLPGASEKWKQHFGGKERLQRLIRDAIPQVKNDIKSESGALLVSMAVTCCAAMCLGPSLRIHDANDGVDLVDPSKVATQVTQNEEVEETMGELVGFAVGSLEDAAMAEEIPPWRSFGLWLLLLMSRAGSMLRASGCEHARAARVLRAWGGMPTGTPGTHTAHASSQKHSSQGSGHHQQQSFLSSYGHTEGVTMFASSSSLAIIDASDVSGSKETIQALCDDLVQ